MLLRHAGWDKRETKKIPLTFLSVGAKVKKTTPAKKFRVKSGKWSVEQHKLHLINARQSLPDCGPMAFMTLYRELSRAYGRPLSKRLRQQTVREEICYEFYQCLKKFLDEWSGKYNNHDPDFKTAMNMTASLCNLKKEDFFERLMRTTCDCCFEEFENANG